MIPDCLKGFYECMYICIIVLIFLKKPTAKAFDGFQHVCHKSLLRCRNNIMQSILSLLSSAINRQGINKNCNSLNQMKEKNKYIKKSEDDSTRY